MNDMGKDVRKAQGKSVLLAGIALLALVPSYAFAQAGAGQTVVVPQIEVEISIVDTSKFDPLEGGEVPLRGAEVSLDVSKDGSLVSDGALDEAEVSGTYFAVFKLDENGPYDFLWSVTPDGSQPFEFVTPVVVAGVPESTAFLTGWRLWAAGLIVLAALVAAFAFGRRSARGNGGIAVGAASVLLALFLVPGTADAHAGHDTAEAAPGTVYADLKVGFGDVATTSIEKMIGDYRVTIEIKVLLPAPFDPDRLTLTEDQANVLGIRTIEVERGDLTSGLAVTGSIQPNPANVVTISSRADGRLMSVLVNVGDSVKAGQVLALVESPEIADAQETFATAQAAQISVEAAHRQALAMVAVAERQLSQQQELAAAGVFSEAPVQLALAEKAEADSELASARADLAAHTRALARLQELFDEGIRSKAELEAAELEVEQDRARQSQAQSRADLAEASLQRQQRLAKTNVLDRKELIAVETALDMARLDLDKAQADVDGARITVTIARARLTAFGVAPGEGNRLRLRAPIDGLVTEREANVGEAVGPEDALFEILNPSVVWVEGDVFEIDLPRVRVDMPAQITTDAVPGRIFEGTVSYMAASVDAASRAVHVRVAVPNPDGSLRPGMFVRVLFVSAVDSQAITVPDEAVQRDAGMLVVYVKNGDVYERREVAVGASSMGRTEIKSGIEPGELVVTSGAYQLKAIGK
ncbi:MAG: efflux RND transporter periplasmic adaptor subunit [Armatimonadetes bacterium]|nr:efflux RND transporter periplasmic adaptor subunit [Armatimonadota bacterium]